MSTIRPTMKTVAQEAGVSIMTVSRALRNQPNIPMETRLRIQKIAEKLGYRPNPLVSTLMAQLRGSRPHKDVASICYLTAYPDPNQWKKSAFNVMTFKGAARRADELGYHLEHFCLTDPGMTFKRASSILRNQGIAGILMGTLPIPAPNMLELRWDWFACASIGGSLTNPLLHRAMVDHFSVMRLTYKSLADLGYRRIGLAIRPVDDNFTDNRWVGGFVTQEHFCFPGKHVPILKAPNFTREAFVKWFMKVRPDAVISTFYEVKRWLQEAGFRVPEDVGVAMPDVYRHVTPDMSGIDQQPELVGALGVDLVVERINANEPGIPKVAKVVTVQGIWAPSETVRRQTPESEKDAAALAES